MLFSNKDVACALYTKVSLPVINQFSLSHPLQTGNLAQPLSCVRWFSELFHEQ